MLSDGFDAETCSSRHGQITNFCSFSFFNFYFLKSLFIKYYIGPPFSSINL